MRTESPARRHGPDALASSGIQAARRRGISTPNPRAAARAGAALLAAVLVSGCGSVPLSSGSTLSSTANLKPEKSMLTKSALYVDPAAVGRARTVRIVPTSHTAAAAATVADAKDLRLVENAIDRAMCVGLSDRFALVGSTEPADLTVRATVTEVLATNSTVAGLSTVATIGASAVSPVPVPRIPIGLGGLGVEGEAVDGQGTQVAGMVWARGATAVTEQARMSKVGDAYSLASKFGSDFSDLIVKGASPFGGGPSIPSMQRIRSGLGGKPKYVACEAFGRAPGLLGAVGAQVGLSPGVTDKGGAGGAN